MRLLLVTLALFLVAAVPALAAPPTVSVTGDAVVLTNGLVERAWARDGLRTLRFVDRRGRDRVLAGERRDFTLRLARAEVGSERFDVTSVRTERIDRGGLRVTMSFAGALPGVTGTRVAEMWPGIAGVRTRTTLSAPAPLALHGATLDEAAVGTVAPTLHAFRAGADWREPDWTGPQLAVGDPHPGTWRESKSAPSGQPLAGPGEWLDAGDAFLVAERADLPSTRGRYDGAVAAVEADFGRDILSLGPFEEQAHAENPTDAPGRTKVVGPGEPLRLEPAFLGASKSDDDAAWQMRKLIGDPYRRELTFNTNGTDDNVISTGAKDDVDIAIVREVAPKLKRLGIETFILDDGWQLDSGDWEPDPARFPDQDFKAVREAIAPMRLGLWMSPLSFHPRSRTFKQHPDWACAPVGAGLAGYNQVDQTSGSNEAGIGVWGRRAIPHVEDRIRHAITDWGVTYFKFDFLVWLDCAGQGDLYDQKQAFVAMLDRIRADHPDVTLQIDETNDYRLFPFESVTRGPSWFQNGSPEPHRLLHNLWNLSPYVPSTSLGQHVLGARQWKTHPVATLMAGALLSHMTVFSDPRQIPDEVVDEAAPWVAFHQAHRDHFTGVTLPLLDDPLERGWTALQSWDPDNQRGALLAFRQDAEAGSTTIDLRMLEPGRTYRLRRGPTGEEVGTFTAGQPVELTLPKRGAEVLLIDAA